MKLNNRKWLIKFVLWLLITLATAFEAWNGGFLIHNEIHCTQPGISQFVEGGQGSIGGSS